MKKVLIIVGSSRSDGNLMAGVKMLMEKWPAQLVELSGKNIGYYDYEHHAEDDFLAIARQMSAADMLVFATPVYWYAMSAPLKTFFDRLADLLGPHKTLGRSLAGKKTYLMACGAEPELPEGFEVPFRRTSEYFDMQYQGCVYWGTKDENLPAKEKIQREIEKWGDPFF